MGSAMQSLYSANPTKQPGQQGAQQSPWGGGQPRSPQGPPTFSTMQQSGQPRPAPPPNWYRYQPGTTPGWGNTDQGYRPAQGPQSPQAPQQPQPQQQQPQQPANAGGGFHQAPPPGMPTYYGGSPYQGPSPQTSQPQQPPSWPPPGGAQVASNLPGAPSAATPPSSYQPPTAAGIYNGVMNNPMVQFGNQMMGYHPPQAPTSWNQPASPNVPPAPPSGISAAGPPQYGATPAASSTEQNTANQLGTATQNLLLNQLQNPNPLGAQAFQTQMQQAQTGINENMQQQTDAINQNLASRGVYDSSLAGGYLKDLSTSAGRQMASIGADLLPQEAQLQLQGTNSALANMLGYGGQQYQQQYQTAGLNLAQQAQQNQQLQNYLQLTGY